MTNDSDNNNNNSENIALAESKADTSQFKRVIAPELMCVIIFGNNNYNDFGNLFIALPVYPFSCDNVKIEKTHKHSVLRYAIITL